VNRSMEHQDRSGAASLPLIVINEQGREVPVPDGIDPSDFAEQLGPGHEALIRCVEHPNTPAVECLICVPEDD
jgi:hypothetical protein